MNMLHFHSIPYAALGFYKLLETTFDGIQRKEFLERELATLIGDREYSEKWIVDEIGKDNLADPKKLGDFLYQYCRLAVAHANKDPAINPDDVGQVRQLSAAIDFLRPLARKYIEQELGVGTNRGDQGERGDNEV